MRKYQKGYVIRSLDDLISHEFIYFQNKVYHHGWFASWHFRDCERYIRHGWIRAAIPIESLAKEES